MPAPIPVRPGQIWADAHWSNEGRTIRITEIDGPWARYVVETDADTPWTSRSVVGRRARVKWRPNGLRGYRLVSEPDDTAGSAT